MDNYVMFICHCEDYNVRGVDFFKISHKKCNYFYEFMEILKKKYCFHTLANVYQL